MEEDSSPFMEWAMDMLLDEHPEPAAEPAAAVDDDLTFPSLQALLDASSAAEMVRELMAADADPANSWSSGDGDTIADNDGTTTAVPAPASAGSMDCYGSWPQSQSSFRRAPAPSSSTSTNPPAVSWNFVTGSAQTGSDGLMEAEEQPVSASPIGLPAEQAVPAASPPKRRACPPKGLGAGVPSPASYAPDHIIAERKRREKINKRLIELSTVVPGLKKMDKATILSAAAKYVKELQQRVMDLEEAAAAGSNAATTKSGNEAAVVLVNKPCSTAAAPEENGSHQSPSTSASSGSPAAEATTTKPPALPEIDARFSSDKSTMVIRVHCWSGKGVAVAVIAEVEDLGLSIVHANVMPSSACTIIITITAKVECLSLTSEEVDGSISSALLSHQHVSCNGTLNEETTNN